MTLNLADMVSDLIKTAERCTGCGFTISLTPRHQRAAGDCPGCRQPVCFICGCTEDVPCGRPVIGGYMPCHWYAPGCCNFCSEKLIELAYQEACRRQEAA